VIFDLANDEKKSEMLKKQEMPDEGFGRNPNIMVTVCSWLSDIYNMQK
jgi:hypothetical protein